MGFLKLTYITEVLSSSRSKAYVYDKLGRLKEAKGGSDAFNNPSWTQSYTYDRYGNRTGVSKSGSGASSIPLDGLASLVYTNAQSQTVSNRITTAGYEYDPAGNQTRGQTENGTWRRYKYDAAGRLAVALDDSSNPQETYSYGASNERLVTVYGNGLGAPATYYCWEGGQVIADFRAGTSSNLVWEKSYVYLGGRLLATTDLYGTKYHHPDRLGTRLVTDGANGTVTTEQVNLPYGTALTSESSGGFNNRRFTSYDRSATTGMDYAVNRFYNSAQGRFNHVDPIGMRAANLGDPQTLNLYSYCGNDPINRIDHDGLFWKWIGKAFKAIAKVLANKWVQLALAVAFAVLSAGSSSFIIHNFALKVGATGIGVTQTASITAAGWWAIGLSSAQAAGGAVSAFSQRNSSGDDPDSITDEIKAILNRSLDAAGKALARSKKCRDLIAGPHSNSPGDLLKQLREKKGFFGNCCPSRQYLVAALCECGTSFQIKANAAEEVTNVAHAVTASFEHFDFVVETFDPTA